MNEAHRGVLASPLYFSVFHRCSFIYQGKLVSKKALATKKLPRRELDSELVPEARFELARLSTTVFETAASAIPPLGQAKTHYSGFALLHKAPLSKMAL